MSELKVVVMAGDPLAHAGLVSLLEEQTGVTVVPTLPEGDMLDSPLADVAVWDLGWQTEEEMARLVALEDAEPPIVALLPDEAYAAEAWAAGVRGLLLREVEIGQLVAALHSVSQGLIVFDARLSRTAAASLAQAEAMPVETLTARELEVLQLMAEGLSNKAIAQRLEISEHTVKFHVNAILGKLGSQSRTEAAMRAARLGLILL
ncbi:MAG: response regulator transcription factor [Anaerolineales bacterium]